MSCDDKKSYVREDIHVDLQYLAQERNAYAKNYAV